MDASLLLKSSSGAPSVLGCEKEELRIVVFVLLYLCFVLFWFVL
jgi:hypothetical protein